MKKMLLRLVIAMAIASAAGSLPCRAEGEKPKVEQKKTLVASGTIEKIDNKAHTMTVRLVLTSKVFKVTPDCEFVLGKKEKAAFENLKVGDEVSVN